MVLKIAGVWTNILVILVMGYAKLVILIVLLVLILIAVILVQGLIEMLQMFVGVMMGCMMMLLYVDDVIISVEPARMGEIAILVLLIDIWMREVSVGVMKDFMIILDRKHVYLVGLIACNVDLIPNALYVKMDGI